MSDDATQPPTPFRRQLGHRAGLRPCTRLLIRGALCVGTVAIVDSSEVLALWREHWSSVWTSPPTLTGMLHTTQAALLWCAIVAASMGLIVAIAARSTGWVDLSLRRSLRFSWQGAPARGVVAAVMPVVMLVLVAGVLAGAARSVDASETGLRLLWWGWARQLLLWGGGVLVAGGFVDLLVSRRQIWRALHRSVADVRQDYQRPRYPAHLVAQVESATTGGRR